MDEALRARRAATELLDSLDPSDAPATAIDYLAARLGLVVLPFHPETRRRGTLGWLEPGEDIIFLRDGIAEPARRFTLAHEIGHFILHRQRRAGSGLTSDPQADDALLALCDGDDLDVPLDGLAADEVLRAGQTYSGRARREAEANAFAASLLLPARWLLERFHALRAGAPATRDRRLLTQRLAAEFGVSEEVLLRRLTALLTGERAGDGSEAATSPATASQSARPAAALDAWQRSAARANTPALVIAGPGTGKTSTLIGRVTHLVVEQDVPADSVLALTFSNKAAGEMRERLAALLASPAPESTSPAMPTVSTIHAFCGDLLRRYGPLVGLRPDFRLVGATDGYFLLRRLADDLVLSRYQPLGAPALHFPTLLAAISRAKDELHDAEHYVAAAAAMQETATTPEQRDAAAHAAEVAAVYSAYQAALVASGDADFGDLIRLAVLLLREQPEILAQVRAQYQHILVDEFQDINRAMGVLLHTLVGERGPLWAVGDADQAIYRFRGASPANLARFTREYPDAHIHTLRRNYRSVPAVLEAAAALASAQLGSGERQPLDASRPPSADPVITLASAPFEDAELEGLAKAIHQRVAAGRSLREQVVLCRTRRQCQRVARFLQDAGVPVRLAAPLLERDEIKDVLAVAALLTDRSGAGLLRAGRIRDHAFSLADARALLAAAQERQVPPASLLGDLDGVKELTPAGRAGLKRLGRVVSELRRSPDIATGLARYLFALTGIGASLLPGAGEDSAAMEPRAPEFARLVAMGRAFDEARRSNAATGASSATREADWAGFLDYVRVTAVLRQEVAVGEELTTPEEAARLRVMTVHASKGLEFPVVYLPGLADRRFPTQRRADPAPLPPGLGDEDGAAIPAEQSHLAEEACLFYVALTRARDEVVLSYADRYGRMRYRPSPFLAPLTRTLGDRLVQARWDPLPDISRTAEREPARERELPLAGADMALRPSAIETFRRCPRQFAYRYVYGLRPTEVGLATLRRSLHDTLTALHADFAAAGNEQSAASSPEELALPSLEEAVALFERRWMAALRDESHGGAPVDADVPPADVQAFDAEPFGELYRRHGRAVIARAWAELARARANASAQDVPRSPTEAAFDQTVPVRVGEREVAVTLDRVEHVQRDSVAGGARGRPHGNGRLPQAQPVRIVRHRFGQSAASTSADVRALFYMLAAEQGYAASAEIVTHNLSTGELEPFEPSGKKLARLREEVDDLLADMQSGIYPARPDPQNCQSCPFLLICPA